MNGIAKAELAKSVMMAEALSLLYPRYGSGAIWLRARKKAVTRIAAATLKMASSEAGTLVRGVRYNAGAEAADPEPFAAGEPSGQALD